MIHRPRFWLLEGARPTRLPARRCGLHRARDLGLDVDLAPRGAWAFPAVALPSLTPLSWRPSEPTSAARPGRAARLVACLSLGGIFAMMLSSGCLVVGSPPIDEPEQTPPFLIASTAFPDLREIFTISRARVDAKDKQRFSAQFVSEDAGVPVRARYFLDYGVENAAGQPFGDVTSVQQVEAGTLADGRRTVTAVVPLAKFAGIAPGCHTLTLMISHAFDDATNCPVSLADSSQLTWMIVVCDSADVCDLSTCPTSRENPATLSCEAEAPDAGGGT